MSPQKCVWESSEAVSLSAENSAGAFDILPDHARFMSLVLDTPVIVELANGETKEFTFVDALLSCDDNNVVIYIQEDLNPV